MDTAKDLLTQEVFIKMRNNQKFKNPQNRIRFHNLKARKKRAAKSTVDRWLDNNRNILIKVLGDKNETMVSKDYLLGAGFSFKYFSFQKPINGVNFAGIYEFGIRQLPDGTFKIIRIND